MFRFDRLLGARLSRAMPIIIFSVAIAAFAAISTTRADARTSCGQPSHGHYWTKV